MPIDPAFGTNNFNKPKMYSESETLARNIVAVLFGKPGAYPTMPGGGMYIQGSLMKMEDDVDTEGLKTELISQCSHFTQVVRNGEFDVQHKTLRIRGNSARALVFRIPTVIRDHRRNLLIGVIEMARKISYNFEWENT